jgi:hypothetical protein
LRCFLLGVRGGSGGCRDLTVGRNTPVPARRELLRPAAGPKGFLASPEKIARVVVRCAERPRPEVIVGNSVRTLRLALALAPGVVERAVARTVERGFLR